MAHLRPFWTVARGSRHKICLSVGEVEGASIKGDVLDLRVWDEHRRQGLVPTRRGVSIPLTRGKIERLQRGLELALLLLEKQEVADPFAAADEKEAGYGER